MSPSETTVSTKIKHKGCHDLLLEQNCLTQSAKDRQTAGNSLCERSNSTYQGRLTRVPVLAVNCPLLLAQGTQNGLDPKIDCLHRG